MELKEGAGSAAATPGWGDYIAHGYGAGTSVNTHIFRLTGRRFPGFWGDMVY